MSWRYTKSFNINYLFTHDLGKHNAENHIIYHDTQCARSVKSTIIRLSYITHLPILIIPHESSWLFFVG
jgi:hypothetical protein